MFNAKNVIGYIGNMAVVKVSNGLYIVNWSNGKRIFVPKESEDTE